MQRTDTVPVAVAHALNDQVYHFDFQGGVEMGGVICEHPLVLECEFPSVAPPAMEAGESCRPRSTILTEQTRVGNR